MKIKVKKKFDKFSTRGIVYILIASILMGYELLTAEDVKYLLIIGYSVIILIGLICLLFLEQTD